MSELEKLLAEPDTAEVTSEVTPNSAKAEVTSEVTAEVTSEAKATAEVTSNSEAMPQQPDPAATPAPAEPGTEVAQNYPTTVVNNRFC